MDSFAAQVRDKSIDDLFQDGSDFARRQPAIVFGAAAVVGFALFRMFKLGVPNIDPRSRRYGGFEPDRNRWPGARTEEVWQNKQFDDPGSVGG